MLFGYYWFIVNGIGRNDDEYLLLGEVFLGYLYVSYFWCCGS